MKVLDFLKSLVLPRKMQKYRYMTIFIAIALFILSMYAFILPARWYYNNKTHDLIVNDNLYYLQSILEMPKMTDEINDFVQEIKEKQCMTDTGEMVCKNITVDEATYLENDLLLGILKRSNKNDNGDVYWLLDNVDKGIIASDSDPIITAGNNELIINNVTNKGFTIENLNTEDKVDLLKISINEKRKLIVNNNEQNIIINSDNISLSIQGKSLYVNEQLTNYQVSNKTVVYFIPNTELNYYEKDFVYEKDTKKINIKFVIDLSTTYTTESQYDYKPELYPNIENDDYFFITVNKHGFMYQAFPKDIANAAIKRGEAIVRTLNVSTSYVEAPLDLQNIKAEDFGTHLSDAIEKGYKLIAVSSFSILTFIYCVLYTLIVTFLFFILFKKSGKLKTFKEYYNIASISNIVPTLLSFVIIFINPVLFGSVYLFSFAVFYLFVLYRINNSPELV